MQNRNQIRISLVRSVLYTLLVAIVVWAFLFLLGIYRYHYHGINPGHIAWLAPTHLPWGEALDKASFIAGVGAAMVLMLGAIVVAAMFVITEAVLFILRIQKGKNNG